MTKQTHTTESQIEYCKSKVNGLEKKIGELAQRKLSYSKETQQRKILLAKIKMLSKKQIDNKITKKTIKFYVIFISFSIIIAGTTSNLMNYFKVEENTRIFGALIGLICFLLGYFSKRIDKFVWENIK